MVEAGNEECLEDVIGKDWKRFQVGKQHDAEQLLKRILNDINFEGEKVGDLKICKNCDEEWRNKPQNQPILSIQAKGSIKDELNEFTDRETLTVKE